MMGTEHHHTRDSTGHHWTLGMGHQTPDRHCASILGTLTGHQAPVDTGHNWALGKGHQMLGARHRRAPWGTTGWPVAY